MFTVAKQIQWNWPESHGEQHVVFILGGLHIEMAALSILETWLEDSGWTSTLVQANIASPRVVNSFVKGSNVKRTQHAHQVTAAVLHSLLTQTYDEYKQTEALEVLSFSDWCRGMTQALPQFHFWYITLHLELLYLVFLQLLRTSCIPLYLDALQKLTPWFFALDHVNYSRWAPVHLHDILTLKRRPQTYAHFLNGAFTA